MSEWREVWKKSINTCQNAIINKCVQEEFDALRNYVDEHNSKPYEKDKMIDFEEGIAYECLGKYEQAIEIYKQVSSDAGLPVKHWRHRASLFLRRAELKKIGKCYSENFEENYLNADYDKNETHEEIQWNAFYELHALINIPSHIRYLAISSMSRIDSEPEMAIVIFRTCLEDILKILYPKEYQEKEENSKTLGPLIVNLFDANILFTKEKSNRDVKKDIAFIIKKRGDDAAHGNEVDYSQSYRSETIILFMQIMQKADRLLSKKKQTTASSQYHSHPT